MNDSQDDWAGAGALRGDRAQAIVAGGSFVVPRSATGNPKLVDRTDDFTSSSEAPTQVRPRRVHRPVTRQVVKNVRKRAPSRPTTPFG